MQFIAIVGALVASANANAAYYPAQAADEVASAIYDEAIPAYVVPTATPCATPIYPAPVMPIAPIVPIVAPTVATVAPVATPVASAAPSTPKAKVHTCAGWNRKYNHGKCDTVSSVKCTLGSGKGSKYGKCSSDVCCTAAAAPVAPAAPSTTYTVVDCAQWASTAGQQCQVAVTGACAVEGATGAYSQCSAAVCCSAAAPAPIAPAPIVLSCSDFCGGNNWNCDTTADYNCALTGSFYEYPTCSRAACCLASYPEAQPEPTPCNNCGDYCPTFCGDSAPVDNCTGCNTKYGLCPIECYSAGYEYGSDVQDMAVSAY